MGNTKRILLYTGKGGVGKTSVAAATALRCAELGYRTVILSTDAAHSLADIFESQLGPEPVKIAPKVWGQEIDVYHSIEKYWGTLQEYLAAIFTWQGVEDLIAEEIAALPGMEEGTGLLWIDQHHKEGLYDIIIVDCAPTADTLRLLSLPDTGRWWFERLFPIGKRATLMLGPLARPLLDDMPIPDRETLDQTEALFNQLGDLHRLLSNPNLSSMRLVVNPEKVVIKEAQRTYTYLNLYGYITDAIICNRVFPEDVEGYFQSWRERQVQHLQTIEESFSPLPILQVPYFDEEILGLKGLRRMADELFQDDDPSRLLFRGKTHTFTKDQSGYLLQLPLPFASRENISVIRNGDELTVQVGNWRRNLFLPRTLRELDINEAKFSDNSLNIHFSENNPHHER